MNSKKLVILLPFALATIASAQNTATPKTDAKIVLTSGVESTPAPAKDVKSAPAKASSAQSATIPPAPKSQPGQCHALVNVPAKLTSKIKDVIAKEAGEKLEIIPAKLEWVEKKIKIADEEKSFEIIPATYKTVKEKVEVEPARKEFEIIPATYKEVKERVKIKPAMRVWKKSTGGNASLIGEVMRLIEVPAQYKTITKKVLASKPQIREKVIAAKQSIIEKRVIDKPASTRPVVVPAKFKKVRVRTVVTKHKKLSTPTKALMQKITISEIGQKAQLKWQRVPCESDLSEKKIIAIQKGLKKLGYDVEPDGQFGKGSQKALEAFQISKGFPKGTVTIETMKALGVNID